MHHLPFTAARPPACAAAAAAAQIKHPGVLKLLEPLEETHSQMVFVSEPVFGSLANLLNGKRKGLQSKLQRAPGVW